MTSTCRAFIPCPAIFDSDSTRERAKQSTDLLPELTRIELPVRIPSYLRPLFNRLLKYTEAPDVHTPWKSAALASRVLVIMEEKGLAMMVLFFSP
jgi:hypothetical protein